MITYICAKIYFPTILLIGVIQSLLFAVFSAHAKKKNNSFFRLYIVNKWKCKSQTVLLNVLWSISSSYRTHTLHPLQKHSSTNKNKTGILIDNRYERICLYCTGVDKIQHSASSRVNLVAYTVSLTVLCFKREYMKNNDLYILTEMIGLEEAHHVKMTEGLKMIPGTVHKGA